MKKITTLIAILFLSGCATQPKNTQPFDQCNEYSTGQKIEFFGAALSGEVPKFNQKMAQLRRDMGCP